MRPNTRSFSSRDNRTLGLFSPLGILPDKSTKHVKSLHKRKIDVSVTMVFVHFNTTLSVFWHFEHSLNDNNSISHDAETFISLFKVKNLGKTCKLLSLHPYVRHQSSKLKFRANQCCHDSDIETYAACHEMLHFYNKSHLNSNFNEMRSIFYCLFISFIFNVNRIQLNCLLVRQSVAMRL